MFRVDDDTCRLRMLVLWSQRLHTDRNLILLVQPEVTIDATVVAAAISQQQHIHAIILARGIRVRN